MNGVKLNNRLLAAGLIFCIAALTFVGAAKGQTIVPGLSAGNNFDYHVYSYWSSSDSYASIPADLLELNQTLHVEVRIHNVNATNVETFVPYYFANGTAIPQIGSVNLFTGEGYGFVAIIGANLNVGDRIHPNGNDTLTVLETVNRNYESGSRPTNHVVISETTSEYTATRNLYFDQATGILVEQVDRQDTNNPASTTIVTWKINSSSVEGWVIPEFPALLAVPIFMIAVAFTAVAFKKKLFKVQVPSKL